MKINNLKPSAVTHLVGVDGRAKCGRLIRTPRVSRAGFITIWTTTDYALTTCQLCRKVRT